MDANLGKKVGQLLYVGVPGTTLTDEQLAVLSKVGVGGVILFKANYESLPQLVSLTDTIQQAVSPNAFEELPAWIGVDQEGGRVTRFGAPFTQWPPAAVHGELNSPKTSFEVGYVMAKELRAAGVNMNFAPVVDVPAALDKSAIGDRAYSTQAEAVSNMGSAQMRGLIKGGVVAVPKHFPGHGAVTQDSHAELPVSQKSIDELDAHEFVPYKKVIRSRAEAIMTAHILFPKIDAERPATMSRKILQDILRKQLRYSKLIISDDLEMGAVTKKYSLKDAAFLAIEAGCDHVLICHEWDEVVGVWEYLVKAFEEGALPMKRLEESLERIADAKRRFCVPYTKPDLASAEALIGSPEFKGVADSIREKRPVESGPSTRDTA